MNRHPLFRRKSVSHIIKEAETAQSDSHTNHLRRTLTVRDLTFFGIAAVIGTGVFTAIGSASASGGPGVVLLFAFTAVACGFAAYCYAEFASMVPISGSAYTYAYVAFGELFAWIIGWDLLMEYAIGNIAVAISWSQYFVNILHRFNINFPEWLCTDYFTAHKGFDAVTTQLHQGTPLSKVDTALANAYTAWLHAPQFGGLRIIMDVPALFIVFLITWIVYRGIKESRTANNIMVYTKLGIILLIIIAGSFYVTPGNWHPFIPHGFAGIMSGVSAVFFAYIGFDAISTTAEECENPQRDLPKGMFNTLIICTVLYIVLVLVLTGMLNYSKLNVPDPLAYIFSEQHSRIANLISDVISASAIIVIASVLLVYQMGQPRIWMSMSRDGLLPKAFSRIHPIYKTPSFATIVTGLFVAIPALFLNLDVVIALTSIGTLFAFVLVCGGIIVLQNSPDKPKSSFKTPFISGRFIVPAIFAAIAIALAYYNPAFIKDFIHSVRVKDPKTLVETISGTADKNSILTYLHKEKNISFPQDTTYKDSLTNYLSGMEKEKYEAFARNIPRAGGNNFVQGITAFVDNIPLWIYAIVSIIIILLTIARNYSLIPVLGLLSCFYLMTGETITNWARFGIWLVIGLVIYFFYSYKNSKLGKQASNDSIAD